MYEDTPKLISSNIAQRTSRKKAAEINHTFHVTAHEVHLPSVLEMQLQCKCNTFFEGLLQSFVVVENSCTAESNMVVIFV